MTADERRLLFIELASRLPYGVIIRVQENTEHEFDSYITSVSLNSIETSPINESDSGPNVFYRIEYCKPYLRPMSSMTKEERKEYDIFCLSSYLGIDEESASNFVDWLNKKMFDYRGLILRDLAFEAPDGIYNIK